MREIVRDATSATMERGAVGRNEWEQGTFRIPANRWTSFKGALRLAYNEGLAADLVLAEQVLTKVKADHKRRRNVDWRAALTQEIDAQDPRSGGGGTFRPKYRFGVLGSAAVIAKACAGLVDGRGKLRSLKKKDFPRATNKTTTFDADTGTISLHDPDRTVVWNVPGGDYACERARSSHMARTLFRLLDGIAWSRGTGGYIVGDDGNNRANSPADVGEGVNLLKTPYYGPVGKREAESRGQRRSR